MNKNEQITSDINSLEKYVEELGVRKTASLLAASISSIYKVLEYERPDEAKQFLNALRLWINDDALWTGSRQSSLLS